MASTAYTSFVSVLGAANAGMNNAKCDAAAKKLYLLAGQYAAQMMTQGYDHTPYPADRAQKLQLANEMFERAELACWTQPGPSPTPVPAPGPAPVPAALSWWWVVGAAALTLYAVFRRQL